MTVNSTDRLRLRCLGGLYLSGGARAIVGAGAQRRPLALLSVLALAGERGVSRDRLALLFWPENDSISARNTLKQIVYTLRRDIHPDVISGTADLRLNPAVISSDVGAFEEAIAQGRLADAVHLYEGAFLEGIYLNAAPEFEKWAEVERTRLAGRFHKSVSTAAAEATARGEHDTAVELWHRLIEREPLDVRAGRALVQALHAGGRTAEALQFARAFEQRHRDEFDLAPDPEFLTLVEELRRVESARARVAREPEHHASETFQTASDSLVAAPSAVVGVPSEHEGASGELTKISGRSRNRRRMAVAGAVAIGVALVAGSAAERSATLHSRQGVRALERWDQEEARSEFRRAIALDSAHAPSHLGLAKLALWSADGSDEGVELRIEAEFALRDSSRLNAGERVLASALRALGVGDVANACRHFDQIIAHDSLDWMAWYGRSECMRRDGTVVPDSGSPSGWRFRSSGQGAIAALMRAVELQPSLFEGFRGRAIAQLGKALPLQVNRARRGRDSSGKLTFAAFPGWTGDSVVYVPFALSDVQAARPGVYPATTEQAVTWGRQRLRAMTTAWIAESPTSADAFEAHAIVLELLGELDQSSSAFTARTALREARRLATTEEQRLRLAVTAVRFLVKSDRLDSARGLSDSLLGAWPQPSPVVAHWIAPLAALTGRPHLASKLARTSAAVAPPPVVAPIWNPTLLPLKASWLALVAHASFGTRCDSLLAHYRELESLLPLAGVAGRVALRRQMLQEPARFAASHLPDSVQQAVDQVGDHVLRLQALVRRGAFAEAQAMLASIDRARAALPLMDRWPDAALLEATTMLQVRDTTRAVAMIDPLLEGLPLLTSAFLDRVQTASSLVRLMALRRDIAEARGEQAVAARWGRAVQALWGGGEAEVLSVTRVLK